MKTLIFAVFLYVSHSVVAVAADTFVADNLSPGPMISASRALRVYAADARTNNRDELKGELALVSLTEELLVERWRKVNRRDVKSRDAVLAEVDQLTKRVDQLLARVSKSDAGLDHERLMKLKATMDAMVGDFRLRLKTAFFQ